MNNEHIWDLIARKLSGEASPAELNELEMILRQDPQMHYSMEALSDMWNNQPEPQAEFTESVYKKHIQRMKELNINFNFKENAPGTEEIIYAKSKSKSTIQWISSAAAALLLVAGIYWFAIPVVSRISPTNIPQIKPNEIVTKYGTRTKLLLPDGTTVWLNAGSRLTYDSDYGNTLREVSLTGEGFFDVVKNKEKPFLIHTGSINIRVLGTAFNVRSYPEEKTIETSLIRGRIEVTFRDRPQEKLILKPNQKLIVINQGASSISEKVHALPPAGKPEMKILHLNHFGLDSLIVETAWIDNKLVFQDESFSDLAKEMERWYGIRIQFEDETLDTLHFTGSFEKENIQQALKALQLISEFNFYTKNGEFYIQKTN